MDQIMLNNLISAIKTDDLVLFSAHFKGNENVSFGRFPILTICYMYGANKIAKKFYGRLKRVRSYRIEEEPFELYKKFRSVAGKSLRLYAGNDSIITPVEMLALVGNDGAVKSKYCDFIHSDITLNKLKTIYNIKGQSTEISANKIRISTKKLTAKQKNQYLIASVMSLVFAVVLAVGCVAPGFVVGAGTESNPFKIASASQFVSAMGNKSHFKLTSDITLNDPNDLEFNGVLDGNNHIVTIKNPQNSLIKTNLGTIKNLSIKYDKLTVETSKSFSFLVGENKGTIENVKIEVGEFNASFTKSLASDIYIGTVATTNSGTISNCSLSLNAKLVATGDGECCAGGFAGKNNGKIDGCEFLGSLYGESVDVAGAVGYNSYGATISNCKNKAIISQTSDLKDWSPNACGLAMTNYGTIKDCVNLGQITAVSTCEDTKSEGQVLVAGISCINYGDIIKCLNKGNLTAMAKVIWAYAGGITAVSEVYERGNTAVLSSITECGTECNINISTEGDDDYVYAGGITGTIYGFIVRCYSITTFTNGNDKDKNFVGLLAGATYTYFDSYWQRRLSVEGSSNVMCYVENVENYIGTIIANNTNNDWKYETSDIFISTKSASEIRQSEVYWNE